MATLHTIDLITSDENIRNGQACIIGTQVRVMDIALAKIVHGQEPEGIATWYDLTLPQVYAGLSYYYQHKSDVDADIRDNMKQARQMKEQGVGKRHSLLP